MDIMTEYARLVEFLGRVMGENCEIVLQDVRKGKNCIVAIANGHISGRKVGSPLTDFGTRILNDQKWQDQDCFCNYRGVTKQNKPLRSSTYFIKEGGQIVGMLCINIDDSRFLELSSMLLRLGGIPEASAGSCPITDDKSDPERPATTETFFEDTNDVTDSVISEYFFLNGISSADRLTQEEKLDIVRRLDEKGVFMVKGTVYPVATKLSVSVASLYRYLSRINREKQTVHVETANGDREAHIPYAGAAGDYGTGA